MDQFQRRGTAVIEALIAFFKDDHAAGLDARVIAIDRRGDEIRVAHVRDKTAALFNLKDRLLAFFPFGDADTAGEHPGIDPDIRKRLGQRERTADDLAILARFRRHATAHILHLLLRRSFFMDRLKREVVGKARGRGAGIHPAQLERDHGQHQVLRPGDIPALLGFHERRGNPRLVKGLEHFLLFLRPVMRMTLLVGHHTSDHAAGHGSGGLNDHLEVITIRKPPHDLADGVPRKRAHQSSFFSVRSTHGR